jgi:hypothetical protein
MKGACVSTASPTVRFGWGENPAWLRAMLVCLGAALVGAVLAQEPRDATRVILGVLGSLVPLGGAALLEGVRFEFDVPGRAWCDCRTWRPIGEAKPPPAEHLPQRLNLVLRIRDDRSLLAMNPATHQQNGQKEE